MNYTELHKIIDSNDSKIKLDVIYNEKEFSEIHIFDKIKLINSLDDKNKYLLLNDEEFIGILYKKYSFNGYNISDIFQTLNEEYLYKLLCDKEYINNILKLSGRNISTCIKRIQNAKVRQELLEMYKEFIPIYIAEIIATFDDETKIDFILNDKELNKIKSDIIDVLVSMDDIEKLMKFFKENKEFLARKHIYPYEVTRNLKSDEKKEEVIARIKEANLTSKEEKEIIVTMPEKLKEKRELFPEEYRYLLDIHLKKQNYTQVIVPDLAKDIGIYKDLDNLIMIDPEEYTEEEKRGKLMQLCKICPNLKVFCSSFGKMMSLYANGEDYIQAETWIISVLDELENGNYTDLQKLAIIDNKIGKKVSYSPDYETEVFDPNESRKIWKIISSGYGVCNGIADVERYVLNRVGIKSKRVSGKGHSFLLLENLKVQNPDGSIRTMNTIIDPTWNLSMHRFGGLPANFCVSYKEIRKHDIDANGVDHECHKNEELITATSSLDMEELRELFKSVGLTREDGKFPIYDWIVESDKIAENCASNLEQYLAEQFLLFEKMYPQFTKCQNESISVIRDIILGNEKIKFNTAVIDKVYEKGDMSRKSIFYIYIQADEFGEKFYIADKEKGKILELSRDEFSKRFECYDKHLSENEGIRPWDEGKYAFDNSKKQFVAGEGSEGR